MPAIALSRRLMNHVLVLAVFSAMALTLDPACAAAQAGVRMPPEVTQYQLTIDGLRRFDSATDHLGALPAQTFDLAAFVGRLHPADLDLDALAAEFDRVPEAHGALSRAGMSSREYVVFLIALLESSYQYGRVRRGETLEGIPDTIMRDNVRFIMEHEDEVAALAGKLNDL